MRYQDLDIVTRLRNEEDALDTEAADEIERLHKIDAARDRVLAAAYAEITALRTALRDIASGKYTGVMLPSHPPKDPAVERAREALGGYL